MAAIGRTSEVAAAIESAVRASDAKCLPDVATTYYRAGMAMQAMGNSSSANQHFQRAIELDPNGRRGTLSKAACASRRCGEWCASKVVLKRDGFPQCARDRDARGVRVRR